MASKASSKASSQSLLDSFAEWGTSPVFASELEAWMTSHAEGFEDAYIQGEQKLLWGAVFSEYNRWLDARLDGFCDRHACSHEAILGALQDALGDTEDAAAARLETLQCCMLPGYPIIHTLQRTQAGGGRRLRTSALH